MPDIKFECPSCQQHLAAPDEMAGQVIECPSCNRQITIPVSTAEEPTAPPAASNPPDAGAQPPPGRRLRRLTRWGLAAGVLSLFVVGPLALAWVPALVIGVIVLARCSREQKALWYRVEAITGMVTGLIGFALWMGVWTSDAPTGSGQRLPDPAQQDLLARQRQVRETTVRRARRTKELWDEFRRIQANIASGRPGDGFRVLDQAITDLNHLNVDYTDQELVAHVRDFTRFTGSIRQVHAQYQADYASLAQGVDSAAQFGAVLGSMDANDSYGSAVGGATLFGFLGAAAASSQAQELQAKYAADLTTFRAASESLSQRESALATKLTVRYSLPFN